MSGVVVQSNVFQREQTELEKRLIAKRKEFTLARGESHIIGIVGGLKSIVDANNIPQTEKEIGRDLIKYFEDGLELQKSLLSSLQRFAL